MRAVISPARSGCRRAAGVRLSQLSLTRGESSRHKLLRVGDLPPDEVFAKIQEALQGGAPLGVPKLKPAPAAAAAPPPAGT